jgi:predicted nucleic acid-binding protein
MSAEPFLDTNILIYAFAKDDPKSGVAESLLAKGGIVSVQVLNEFANVSRRKLRLEWRQIDERIALLKSLLRPVAPPTLEEHDQARALAREHKLSFYDALIVASALNAGATLLLSEDMQHERAITTLTIKNPFINT